MGKDFSEVIKKSRALTYFSSGHRLPCGLLSHFNAKLKTVVVVEKKAGITHTLTPQGHQGQVGAASAETSATTGFDAFQMMKKQRLKGSFSFRTNFVQEMLSTMYLPWSWMACQSHTWLNKGGSSWAAFTMSLTLLVPLKEHNWCLLISFEKGWKTTWQATQMTMANQLKSRSQGMEEKWQETLVSLYWVLHFCKLEMCYVSKRESHNHRCEGERRPSNTTNILCKCLPGH